MKRSLRFDALVDGPESLANTYTGSTGDNKITGTKFSDLFYSSAGTDTMDGRDGIDRLIGDFRGNSDGLEYSSYVSYQSGVGVDAYIVGGGVDRNTGHAETSTKNIEVFDLTLSSADDSFELLVSGDLQIDLSVKAGRGNNTLSILCGDSAFTFSPNDQGVWSFTSENVSRAQFVDFTSFYVMGSSGDDVIITGDGDDHLDGGPGANRLTGNGGADTFFFAGVPSLGLQKSTFITDFRHSDRDKIDLSNIDARSSTVTVDDAFHYIRGREFSGQSEGELRSFSIGKGLFMVQGDTDGDGRPDFSIIVDSPTKLVASDFVL